MKKIVLLIAVIAVFSVNEVWANSAKQEYKMAVDAARQRQYDFAFMHYRAISRLFPRSPYRDEALFAEGEYYCLLGNFKSAVAPFENYVKDFPEAEGRIFALAHLYAIAMAQNDSARADQLRSEIVNLQQVSLVFRDFKEYKFQSPFFKGYRAVFQIDTIEFYVDGELYSKIKF